MNAGNVSVETERPPCKSELVVALVKGTFAGKPGVSSSAKPQAILIQGWPVLQLLFLLRILCKQAGTCRPIMRAQLLIGSLSWTAWLAVLHFMFMPIQQFFTCSTVALATPACPMALWQCTARMQEFRSVQQLDEVETSPR